MKKGFSKDKDRLVILLGAGSTIRAGAPSTEQITQHVRSLGLKNGILKAVVDGLETQRGRNGFNFETVIYALDELEEYFLRKKRPDAWDLVGGVLSAFTSCLYQDLESEHDPFVFHRLGLAVLRSIAEFVWTKTKDASPTELRRFLDRLRDQFRLTVFTLNYDDIVDCAGNWFDGFADAQSMDGPHSGFNTSQFRARFHMESESLAHLHGSVRFGYSGGSTPELVKYDMADQALKSLEDPPANASSQIISGFQKETKLLRTPVPFGYYYQAFTEAILDTPRLLLAGYGGWDPHVSTWFEQFTHVHGERWRVVAIDIKKFPETSPSSTFLPIEASFPPIDEATLDKIVDHLRSA